MSNVQFEEDNSFITPSMTNKSHQKASWIEHTIIKWGIAKDQAGANKVLLGIALGFVILSIIIYIYGKPRPPVRIDNSIFLSPPPLSR